MPLPSKPAAQLERAEAEKIVDILADDGIAIDLLSIMASKTSGSDLEGKTLGFDLQCEVLWLRLEQDAIICLFPFSVSLNARASTADSNSEGAEFGKVMARFRITYRFRESIAETPDDLLENFAGIYGPLHLWPYWRAEVQGLTTKLALPPLTLPLLKYGTIPDTFSIRQLVPEGPEQQS